MTGVPSGREAVTLNPTPTAEPRYSRAIRWSLPLLAMLALAASMWLSFIAGRMNGAISSLGLVRSAGAEAVGVSALFAGLIVQLVAIERVAFVLLVIAAGASLLCLDRRVAPRPLALSLVILTGVGLALDLLIAS
jgi:hypothetical protein